ncbi:hypothetical protein Q3O60_15815 [Alkalimonas collagenimarina]|uniref:DUF6795 domain-containing protein n=1 Tax=Alkalimonas collagenimarina TaxID=400390 RepID=A0ABT9H361_9GAMM|nr:DUF6795 domain-containing protein [Alkalimonas collagenimarina]MDP4537653.1 hypothetical protein [Alkalimonas collagenimarina]
MKAMALFQGTWLQRVGWIGLGVVFLFSAQVHAGMFGWLKRYDVHLCPEVRGVITHNGTPLAGVTVYRELDYDKSYTDSVVTDKEGRFFFTEKNIRSRLPGNMFDQSTVRQVLSLDYQQKNYVLWYSSTPSLKPHSTFQQALATLQCELADPEQRYVLNNEEYPQLPLGVVGICKLDAPLAEY